MAPKAVKRPAAAVEGVDDDDVPAMGRNAAQDLKNKLKAMAKAGREYPLEHYEALAGHKEKRLFASKFAVDKSCAWLEIEEKEFVAEKNEKASAGGWMHLWDVARLNGISYTGDEKQMEFLLALVSSCPAKDSPGPTMLMLGHKLYDYHKSFEDRKRSISGSSLELKARAKVKDEGEWKQCSEMMSSATTPGAKRMPKKTKKALGGEKEVGPKKDWLRWAGKSTSQLSGIGDKMDVTLAKLKVAMSNKKPWVTKAMVNNVDKEKQKLNNMKERIMNLQATAEHLSPTTFSSKKYTDVQEACSALVDLLNDSDQPNKQAEALIAAMA